MNLKVIGCLAILLFVVATTDANERPAPPCVVYFSVVEDDQGTLHSSMLKMDKPQSSWYEKHGRRDYAGICYVEKGDDAPAGAPLYAVVWGKHLVNEPYNYSYQTVEPANGNVRPSMTDQTGNASAVSDTSVPGVPASHTSSETKKSYVADGWLAVWDPKTNEAKGSFVPVAPLHSHDRTVLSSSSTSLLKDALEQISEREKERLVVVVANEKESQKASKGENSRESGKGWAEITVRPMNNGQTVATEPSPAKAQGTPEAAQPAAAVPENSVPVASTVAVSSTPPGADIYVDEDFVGNTPSSINVAAGKHVIIVQKSGFQDWVRTVNFSGGTITLNAELISSSNEVVAAGTLLTPESPKESAPAVSTKSSQRPVGWIGLSATNGSHGALVTNVTSKGPAARAGIRVGDIILALDGKLVNGTDFQTAVAALKPGTRVPVSYTRGSSAHEVWIIVASQD